MKRLMVAVVVFVLCVGPCVALAESPDYIVINRGRNTIIFGDNPAPPDVTVILPSGAIVPPENAPPE